MPMYVFQKDDHKYELWSRGLERFGIDTAAIQGSPIHAPAQLLSSVRRSKRPHGYVFRYLNDYPSLAKTVLRLISEAVLVGAVKLLRGRLFWIAHNVDNESVRHHRAISALRRQLVSRMADAIFVTDPLLVPYARHLFPHARDVDWVCFGPPTPTVVNDDTLMVQAAIRELRERIERRKPTCEVFIGLCVSSPEPKCLHLLHVCDFIDRCSTHGVAVGVVVVGEISGMTDERYVAARRRMTDHEQIILIDRRAVVREAGIANDIDFVYRALDDHSVPFTVYVAASIRKPIITESDTFVAELVTAYSLGGVAPPGESRPANGEWLVRTLRGWDPGNADRFLETHDWDIAASRLARRFLGE